MNRSLRIEKLGQASMNLATNFDEVGATKQTIMSDNRDFSRPRESFYTSNTPTDSFQVSDGDNLDNDIGKFQIYFGLPQTGMVDDKLIAAAKGAEDRIAKVTNNPNAHGLLWDDINKKFKTTVSDLQEALKKVQQYETTKTVNSQKLLRPKHLVK